MTRRRCTLHKRRNVVGHLPKEQGRSVDRRLATIFADPDADRGLSAARRLAHELQADQPDAAASLREGLEDMFTVRRLGITGALARTLTNTNCIESMIWIAPADDRPGDPVEGPVDEEALDRSRHARGRALVPPGPWLQGHGQTRRRPESPRQPSG